MGVFAVKNDVGIGTIVGSAVFSLCCIIGGTAVFTPVVLTIDWKPITRDTLFYGISIVAMIMAGVSRCCGEVPAEKVDDEDEKDDDDDDEEEEAPISKAIARPMQLVFEVTI